MDTLRKTTATRLSNAKALGISLKAVSEIAGVDMQKVYRFERESGSPNLTAKEVQRLAGALDEIKGAL